MRPLFSNTILLFALLFTPAFLSADDHEHEDQEERQEILTEINEIWPEIVKNIELPKGDMEVLNKLKEHLIQEEPEELLEQLEHYLEILEHDGPELLNMEMHSRISEFRVHLLVDKFHQARNDKEKSALKQELRKQLAALMEVRLKHRIREFEQLSEELARIKKGIDAVKKDPDHFIDRKLSELLGDHFDPFD